MTGNTRIQRNINTTQNTNQEFNKTREGTLIDYIKDQNSYLSLSKSPEKIPKAPIETHITHEKPLKPLINPRNSTPILTKPTSYPLPSRPSITPQSLRPIFKISKRRPSPENPQSPKPQKFVSGWLLKINEKYNKEKNKRKHRFFRVNKEGRNRDLEQTKDLNIEELEVESEKGEEEEKKGRDVIVTDTISWFLV